MTYTLSETLERLVLGFQEASGHQGFLLVDTGHSS